MGHHDPLDGYVTYLQVRDCLPQEERPSLARPGRYSCYCSSRGCRHCLFSRQQSLAVTFASGEDALSHFRLLESSGASELDSTGLTDTLFSFPAQGHVGDCGRSGLCDTRQPRSGRPPLRHLPHVAAPVPRIRRMHPLVHCSFPCPSCPVLPGTRGGSVVRVLHAAYIHSDMYLLPMNVYTNERPQTGAPGEAAAPDPARLQHGPGALRTARPPHWRVGQSQACVQVHTRRLGCLWREFYHFRSMSTTA